MQAQDIQQKFMIDSCDVRGQLVKLNETWNEAVARVEYPAAVKQVLGEAFVAALLLASTIKFEGKLTLQVRGKGPVHLLVVQVTDDARVRGLARWHEVPVSNGLQSLFGDDARMSITIEANRNALPYQGIVPLTGESLAEALQQYFRSSEQLPTQLYLAVNDQTAAGLLIQKLPDEQRTSHDADGWARATILSSTLSEEDLCNEDIFTLLQRLFHQEQVRVFDSEKVMFHCNCSRERTDSMLLGLGEAEVQSIVDEQGQVEITCEFCDSTYTYDSVDAIALFKGIRTGADAIADDQSTKQHRPNNKPSQLH
ncbi:MAG: Hsp33 family molecular chaperone HslO [Granulosicoccus sp.]|nr:Hsp33 family molecular chaperone HslO [Granulosicoccus sp.]